MDRLYSQIFNVFEIFEYMLKRRSIDVDKNYFCVTINNEEVKVDGTR